MCFMVSISKIQAQNSSHFSRFFIPSDSFNKNKTIVASSFAVVAYSAFSSGLYYAWYKNSTLSKLHSFDDRGEWFEMDKCGHVYDGYFQSALCYQGARWCGISENKSIVLGVGTAMLFQSTIELFDGFSDKWGFSWSDMAANCIGAGTFAIQQKLWKKQFVQIKFSTYPVKHPANQIIQERTEKLFGNSLGEKLLKDYNAQTYWLSFNPFAQQNKKYKYWPRYLQLSLGYGVNHLYGGYENKWKDENGTEVILDPLIYPRYRRYFLSLDIDFKKLPVRNPFLKTIFHVINIVKLPFPALEYNCVNGFEFHPLKF